MKTDFCFVPKATSQAGLCLTPANWHEAGITTLSYSLESLLIKPGLKLLQSIPDIRKYLGWDGMLILNAEHLVTNKEGLYTLTSSFDGTKIHVTPVELIGLIKHLRPDMVILPKKITEEYPDIWNDWKDTVKPFIYENDQCSYGTCFKSQQQNSQQSYITGNLSLVEMTQLKTQGTDFIVESDLPANDAIQGRVYTAFGVINLADSNHSIEFDLIDSNCKCPTCSQQFTKAYLHHLFHNTPLLCQRFLLQHNIWAVNCSGQDKN